MKWTHPRMILSSFVYIITPSDHRIPIEIMIWKGPNHWIWWSRWDELIYLQNPMKMVKWWWELNVKDDNGSMPSVRGFRPIRTKSVKWRNRETYNTYCFNYSFLLTYKYYWMLILQLMKPNQWSLWNILFLNASCSHNCSFCCQVYKQYV